MLLDSEHSDVRTEVRTRLGTRLICLVVLVFVLEETVLRIQNLAQVMSPKGLSTTRSSLSKRLSTPLKRVRFQKLRISSLSPFTSQDSIESLVVPQETDLDDEQIRALLASPRYLLKREASAERSQIYQCEREGLM